MTISSPLLGLEQAAQHAELRLFLCAIQKDLRPLRVHSDSAYVLDVWHKLQREQSLAFDGDILEICRAIFRVLPSRNEPVEVVKVAGHSGHPLTDASYVATKAGAAVHHRPSFLNARLAFWSLRELVKHQRMILVIVLERCRLAKEKVLLTFAKKQQQSSLPARCPPSSDYLLHPDFFWDLCGAVRTQALRTKSQVCFGELCYSALR